MEYIRTALEDYREGRRTAVEPMDRKIRALTPQELEALAHFYASPVEGDG
jgi:cytochrome c553